MTENRSLGAAVVGTGFGVLTHTRALQAAGITVHALVGRDADKTAVKAEQFGIPHPTTSLADALSVPGVDIVAVATPPYVHAPITLEAIAAGKHVLCEKPFARDVTEATSMLDAAQAAGIVHVLGCEFRFGSGQALLTRVIREGIIGEPKLALFELHIPTLADPKAELPGWWEHESEGGGWLGAHGSHVVDQIRTTLGEFDSVSASLQTVAPRPKPMTADDTYTVQFRLRNGVEGIMHSSCAASGQFVMVTKITGSGGSAWLQGDEVWVDDGDGPRQVPPPDDLPLVAPAPPPDNLIRTAYDGWHSMGIDLAPYTRLCAAMADQIEGRPVPADPVAATFADGVAAQAVLDAVHLSSSQHQWISINDVTRGIS